MVTELVIGSHNLLPKDELVLRALVRVLDGGISSRLRFSERLAECNVVFAPAHQPAAPPVAQGIMVRVGTEGAPAPAPVSDLTIAPPLRMTNMLATLESAAQRLFRQAPHPDPMRALHALYALICERLRSEERRRMVIPMGAGQQIILDVAERHLYTAMTLESILDGRYAVETPHRVSAVEEELIRSLPRHGLPLLLWGLSTRLAHGTATAPLRPGRYHLLRWPEAAGLIQPGHPRLAALLTQRALTVGEASEASGAAAATVCWFIETCLALGIAAEQAHAPPPRTPHSPASTGWLGQLRTRLKLW